MMPYEKRNVKIETQAAPVVAAATTSLLACRYHGVVAESVEGIMGRSERRHGVLRGGVRRRRPRGGNGAGAFAPRVHERLLRRRRLAVTAVTAPGATHPQRRSFRWRRALADE